LLNFCLCGCGSRVKNKYVFNHHSKSRSLSDEHKQRIGVGNRGKIISEEQREKLRQWNLKYSPRKGEPLSEEHKKKISSANKGKKASKEARLKMSLVRVGRFGSNNHWNWKGGITNKNSKIRASDKYKEWRTNVFERDNYTCQHCDNKNRELVAHHINRFSNFPDERLSINNGITCCRSKCHYELERLSIDTENRTNNYRIYNSVGGN